MVLAHHAESMLAAFPASESTMTSSCENRNIVGSVALMSTSVDRVREVIERSGATQGDFAVRIGLDAAKMSKSLSGARRFSSFDLARIAEAGQVTVDWLLTGYEPPLAIAARAASGAKTQQALVCAQRLAELRDSAVRLGYGRPVVPVEVRPSGSWKRDGEALADGARVRCAAAGVDVAADLPGAIEQVFGIDVAIIALGDKFDGLAARASEGAFILAASTANFARQRFTIAHELGHLLWGDDQHLHVDVDIDAAPSKTGESEIRANSFAAAFLMPRDEVRELVAAGFTEATFDRLVLHFRVSPAAMANRLEQLNLVNPLALPGLRATSYASVLARSGQAGVGALHTDGALRERPPQLLSRDLLDAYLVGKTTLRLYAAALGVDVEQVRAQLEAEG